MEATGERPLLGLRGDMGAGKDTLAEEIRRRFPEYTVRKFATALRRAVEALTGIPPERSASDADKAVDLSGQMYSRYALLGRVRGAIRFVTGGTLLDGLGEQMFAVLTGFAFAAAPPMVELPMTVGRLLQVLGTECFRDMVGPDVWVDALFRGWDAEGRPPIVIADTRFPNETAAIRARAGAVVLVRRRLAVRADGRAAGHISERALDGEPPDVTIDNDGEIGDLGPALQRAWPAVLACTEARGAGTPLSSLAAVRIGEDGFEAVPASASAPWVETLALMEELRLEEAAAVPWTDARRRRVRCKVARVLSVRQALLGEGPTSSAAAAALLEPLALRTAFEVMVDDGRFWRVMLDRSWAWPAQSGDQALRNACMAFQGAHVAAHGAYLLDIAARLGAQLPWDVACLITRRLVEMRLGPD